MLSKHAMDARAGALAAQLSCSHAARAMVVRPCACAPLSPASPASNLGRAVQVLGRVWGCDDHTALHIAERLAAPGVIRYATLETGAVWCGALCTRSVFATPRPSLLLKHRDESMRSCHAVACVLMGQ